MNIDERLAFLLQSTESLHASVQENTANIAALTRNSEGVDARIAALTAAIEMDAVNIRSLANIAGAHEDRISKLEGGA